MNPNVLFIDDDYRVLQALVRRMRKEPFNLHTATRAEEAIGILNRTRVDLIVCDLQMPGMSGIELLSRASRDYPDSTRIMLTGNPSLNTAVSAINDCKVYKFFSKPVNLELLTSTINTALSSKYGLLRSTQQDLGNYSSDDSPHVANTTRINPPGLSQALIEQIYQSHETMRLGNFRIESIIGRGSMGLVLKAFDEKLKRRVALKFIAPERAQDSDVYYRFTLEAQCSAKIRHHNVVTVYAVDEFNGVPFIVMEYIEGDSLESLMEKWAHTSFDSIGRLGKELVHGLDAAHALGIIHRDVKPANIIIERPTARVCIADFGLARALDCNTRHTRIGTIVGTPQYLAPEQIEGAPLSTAVDFYSLGTILYELTTRAHPFDTTSLSQLLRSICHENPQPVRSRNPEVPRELAMCIEQLLHKDPAARLSALDFLRGYQ